MNNTTIDKKTFTITFERRVPANREEVFDAWTRPEQIAEWWDPTGTRLAECRIDLRPGGAFHFANTGHSPPFTGTYSIVDRPSKLVFEALGSVGTVLLERAGPATQMKVTIRCGSKEQLDHFIRLGVAKDTERTLDNLVARYEAGAAQRPSA
jgi:uncharacterized protein YndB with AHSA1/START domain